MMSDETTPTSEPVAELIPKNDPKLREARAEYSRLKLKLRESKDKDLKRALESRIKELREEWGEPIELTNVAAARRPTIELPEDRTKPTEQMKRDAEALIARARLELSRNNTRAGEDLLMQAVNLAPGDPGIMEALGDYYMTKKRYDTAKVAYERARELYPESVSIERKFGTAVLHEFNIGSIDDQTRLAMAENIFLNPGEGSLGGFQATIVTLVWPGLGHLIAGRTPVGIGLMATWLISSIWFFLNYTDFARAIGFAAGKGTHPSFAFAPPLLIMFVTLIIALKSVSSVRPTGPKIPINRPAPPVDLPFE